MPLLDVSDVLSDPMFTDAISVKRTTASVDAITGRTVSSEAVLTGYAVVTSDTGKSLDRTSDAAMSHGTITIHTTMALSDGDAADGTDADVVTWNGRDWTVVRVDDYSRYGAGFFAATCSLRPLR